MSNLFQVGHGVDVYANQDIREGEVIAVIGDEVLIEYKMPAGRTFLRRDHYNYIDNTDPHYSGYKTVSYETIPDKWLKKIAEGGGEWKGQLVSDDIADRIRKGYCSGAIFVPKPKDLWAYREAVRKLKRIGTITSKFGITTAPDRKGLDPKSKQITFWEGNQKMATMRWTSRIGLDWKNYYSNKMIPVDVSPIIDIAKDLGVKIRTQVTNRIKDPELGNTKWLVTKDFINNGEDDDKMTGIGYPQIVDPNELDRPFRLLDDDGEVYFEGILSDKEGPMVEPLEDLGYAFGCTALELYENGQWTLCIG